MSVKRFFKTFWIFIPLVLAAAMYFLLPLFPEFTEYVISRGLNKILTLPIGFITSLVPISLTELAAVLAIPLLVFGIIMFIVRIKKSADRKKTALKGGRFVCGFLSIAAFLYMAAHGANYYRQSMEQLMELDTSQKTAEQLLSVCIELAENAAAVREECVVDESGCVALSEDIFTELSRAGSGYDRLIEQYPFLWTSVWRQKPVMLSYYWSFTGITGMYFPFFSECNVNIEQPDFTIPYTAAHESAHSRGIAFENECNFLAFLSCINSEYAEYRYSGYMEAFVSCSNALYRYDKDLWAQAHSYCTQGMISDFTALNAYVDAFKGEVQELASAANDTFIKAQGVADGTLSYDRVTELILAYYDKQGLI